MIQLIVIVSFVILIFAMWRLVKEAEKTILRLEKSLDKKNQYYELLNSWIRVYGGSGKMAEYLDSINCQRIAIYGMGELGRNLYDELKESQIQVMHGIDKSNSNFSFIEMKSLDDDGVFAVDAVIVTPIHAYDVIKKDIEKKANGLCKIISLQDLIYKI